jgi:hypothetical protein
MSLPKNVTMVPGGGNYYRARAFRLVFTYGVLPFVLVAILLALINPFWFRDAMGDAIERGVNRLVKWRNYRQYAIYLGADPKVWHALKGDSHE